MAITRLGHIKQAVGTNKSIGVSNAIKYILNPEKTEKGKLVGVHNLVMNSSDVAGSSYDQMVQTKEAYGKLTGRQGYHYKISFAKDDKVTPEMAMEIAKEFCETHLKDYEAVYAVHTNTEHLHFHIVFNSVSLVDGLKYHYADGDWKKDIQPIVNKLCEKRGLSIIDEKKPGKKEYRNYGIWKADHKDQGSPKRYYTWERIRADMDTCIKKAKSYDEFLNMMSGCGYMMDDSGKHLRIYAPGRVRPVRSYVVTPDKMTYTKENIKRMIAGTYLRRDRREVLNRMYRDWNVFLRTERIKVVGNRFRNNLKFAQREEAVRMILTHDFRGVQDADNYLQYLEAADRELNIIKKYVKSYMDLFSVYEDKLQGIVMYARSQRVTNPSVSRRTYQWKSAMRDYMDLVDAGVNPLLLYRLNATAVKINKNVDAFKKKLYVDKQIVRRIINSERDERTTGHIEKVER